MGSTVTQFETGLRKSFMKAGGEGLEDVGFYCELQTFTTHTHTHTHTHIHHTHTHTSRLVARDPTLQMRTGGFTCGMLRVINKILFIYLFSRLYNVFTSSCAHLTIILSSSSSCLCHSSLLPVVPFPPSVL
jgi:hypothetical protein